MVFLLDDEIQAYGLGNITQAYIFEFWNFKCKQSYIMHIQMHKTNNVHALAPYLCAWSCSRILISFYSSTLHSSLPLAYPSCLCFILSPSIFLQSYLCSETSPPLASMATQRMLLIIRIWMESWNHGTEMENKSQEEGQWRFGQFWCRSNHLLDLLSYWSIGPTTCCAWSYLFLVIYITMQTPD